MDIKKEDPGLLELLKALQQEIINRNWAEKKATDALDYAESIIDSVQSPLIVLDDEYKVISANVPFYELFGLSPEESIGTKFFEAKNGRFDIPELKNVVVSDEMENLPIQLFQDFKLRGKRCLQIKCVNLQYNIKHLKFKLLIINDITDLINTQNRLEQTVKEKQMLLTEIKHRIKNNLYVIESILRMELSTIDNTDAHDHFQNTISRIHSIGLLYDKLFQSKNTDYASIKTYLEELIHDIKQMYMNKVNIVLDDTSDDFELEGEVLFNLGLILNELITNAMKYAFNGISDGLITIRAAIKSDQVTIIIHDNGNCTLFNFDESPGFGIQLSKMLVQQLHGKIEYEIENGTKCILTFNSSSSA